MSSAKEKMLTTALVLFAANGYEAVSVSDIAGQRGYVFRKLDVRGCVFNNWAVFYNGKFVTVNQLDGTAAEKNEIRNRASAYDGCAVSRSCSGSWTCCGSGNSPCLTEKAWNGTIISRNMQ